MPNWCDNKGSIELKDGVDVEKFIEKIGEKISDDQFRFDYNKMIPMPDGADWYEFNTTNWGCKWNDNTSGTKYFYQPDDIDEGLWFYDFLTPWGPPQGIMEFLWNMDEVEEIEWYFREEGMEVDGLFKDGKWFEKKYIEVKPVDKEVQKEIMKQLMANFLTKYDQEAA